MNIKESINWLDAIINNPKACGGNLEENNQALNTIKRELAILEVFKRLITSKEVWKDVEFGTDKNKLYIDGDITYKDEQEKKLFLDWLKENTKIYTVDFSKIISCDDTIDLSKPVVSIDDTIDLSELKTRFDDVVPLTIVTTKTTDYTYTTYTPAEEDNKDE